MSVVQFHSEAPFADLAHLVERHLAKVEVASSSLVIRSTELLFLQQLYIFLAGLFQLLEYLSS